MNERTEVCLTIDTEFSIGGAFEWPDRLVPVGEPAVSCRVGGREHGLGFVLETLERYGLKATFFVETLNTFYFGDAPMEAIARRIHDTGHDVQLHLHPCWTYFRTPDWRASLANGAPSDSCAKLPLREMVELIRHGIETFERWGLPSPVALRTGGFETSRTVYQAMAQTDVPIGSNIGSATFDLGDPALALPNGRHWIDDVLEVPVLTYLDRGDPRALGRGRRRNLQITSTSMAEMRVLLGAARRAGQTPIVVLTHPFEFVKRGDPQYQNLRPNQVNQARFKSLCGFLRSRATEFDTTTFSAAAEHWLAAGEQAGHEFAAPLGLAMLRTVQNVVNDLV